ncbi:MAG: hypothetical protein WD063_15035 [Pirellulales bacterium]
MVIDGPEHWAVILVKNRGTVKRKDEISSPNPITRWPDLFPAAEKPRPGPPYEDLLGEYWPPERRMVEARYATIAFPFRELPAPRFAMTAQWNLDDLVGYLGRWSSVQKYIERHAADPLSQVRADLAAAWGLPEMVRRVTWPLLLRVGLVDEAERRTN